MQIISDEKNDVNFPVNRLVSKCLHNKLFDVLPSRHQALHKLNYHKSIPIVMNTNESGLFTMTHKAIHAMYSNYSTLKQALYTPVLWCLSKENFLTVIQSCF